jgi:hypothetical protein
VLIFIKLMNLNTTEFSCGPIIELRTHDYLLFVSAGLSEDNDGSVTDDDIHGHSMSGYSCRSRQPGTADATKLPATAVT